MPIAVQFYYRPRGAEDRLQIRDVHLEYMMANRELILFGGGIMDGQSGVGMYLLFKTDVDTEVDAFMQGEPYCRAALFDRIERVRVVQYMPEPTTGLLENLLHESRIVAKGLRGES